MKYQKGDVYVIFNKLNHKILFGETSRDGGTRLAEHVGDLKKGIERNKLLQEDFNRFGEDAFEFKVIIKTSEYKLCELVIMEIFSRIGMAYNDKKNSKYKEIVSIHTTKLNSLYGKIEDFLKEWDLKLPYYRKVLEELEDIKKNGFEFKSEKLYQREYKNLYLTSNYEDVDTVRVTKQLFINSYNLEMKVDKDLYDFTYQEAKEFLYSLKAKTTDSLRNLISKLSKYLDYAIRQGVSNNKINYYKKLSKEKSMFVDREAEENMIFDRDEIMEMTLNADNAQDGVILALLFEGLSHKNEFEELTELTIDDVDLDNNEIILEDRTIPMGHETKMAIKDAYDQERKYTSINGEKTRNYKIAEGKNIIRGLRGKVKVKGQIISQRILRIADIFGYPYLNATNVSYSGQIHNAVELMNNGMNIDDAVSNIIKRFGINNNTTSRFYLKTRIEKYLEKRKNSVMDKEDK
jgi:hypothetical protein